MTPDKHPAEALADAVSLYWINGRSDEISDMLRRIPALEAERDAMQQSLYDEIDANFALRDLGGATADEDMGTFLRRVIAERDKLRAEIERLSRLLDEQGKTSCSLFDTARQNQLDAERYRWLKGRLMSCDWDYMATGDTALIFTVPPELTVSADCDDTVDSAMRAAG